MSVYVEGSSAAMAISWNNLTSVSHHCKSGAAAAEAHKMNYPRLHGTPAVLCFSLHSAYVADRDRERERERTTARRRHGTADLLLMPDYLYIGACAAHAALLILQSWQRRRSIAQARHCSMAE
eukprot:GHVU01036482.1.p2 GENE.GHVU01036482.1~~GHVU01036482.1.p2  ORF type:complete len:123 (-),score=10.65 GHVU01036482.1:2413-2781(-)